MSDGSGSRPLLGPDELAAARNAGRRIQLLDVRWRLDIPEGRPAYLAAHLPGAIYVDLANELAVPGTPISGRYPLPPRAQLQDAVRRWGIRAGDTVVAYDDNDGVAAARLWWLLHPRGIRVRVLDGGLRGWVRAGLPIERGDIAPPGGGSAVLSGGEPDAVTIDEAALAPRTGVLIDVRAPGHYRGQTAGAEPLAGHIPGAINVPASENIAEDGTMASPDAIRETFARAGVDGSRPIVLYCAVGVASAHTALALASAGIDSRVFPGSWSQWAHTPGRPVAVGPTPGDDLDRW